MNDVAAYAAASIELAFVKRNEFYAECPQGYRISVGYVRGEVVYTASRSEHRAGNLLVPAEALFHERAPADDERARTQAYRRCKAACAEHYAKRAKA